MAEILVRKRKHFAEDAKPAEWTDMKWNGRPMSGDIIEVRENGYYRVEALGTGTHGWSKDGFALIRIPNVSVQDVIHLARSYSNETDTTPATVFYARRYRIPNIASKPWNKKTMVIDGKTVEEWYKDFNNLNLALQIIADKVGG